jgi:hypothetical protein
LEKCLYNIDDTGEIKWCPNITEYQKNIITW